MSETFSRASSPVSEPRIAEETNNDSKLLQNLEKAIFRSAKGRDRFQREVPILLRKAIDEVIDSARTDRVTLNETEKTEKTYLGTKVEILLRNFLEFPRGEVLDLSVDGIEVDIKNTMHGNWMIPSEAIGHPCILVKIDEESAQFSIGLFVARREALSSGTNKDGKSSISKAGRDRIHWIAKDQPYPKNFWQSLSPDVRRAITSPQSGSKRVDALFRLVQATPISRAIVLGAARQKDAMKRLRKNGGARDSLNREGIALLSGQYDRAMIEGLQLPHCGKDEFISFSPVAESDKSLLRRAGRIK
jgi:hypothetical protein